MDFKPSNYLKQAKIELTSRCNVSCKFCYLKIRNGSVNDISGNDFFSIADRLKELGIANVRLSGGEPFLHRDLQSFIEYLRGNAFRIRIVTNGSLIDEKFLRKFKESIYCYHISFHKKTRRQIKCIELFERLNIKYSLNTIIAQESIGAIDSLFSTVNSLDNMVQWTFLREFPAKGIFNRLRDKDIARFIEKLLEFKNKSKKEIYIGNPFPFCAYFPEKVRKVVEYKCNLFNDSLPSDFTIDFEGYLRPCSIINYRILDFIKFDKKEFREGNKLFNLFRKSLYKTLPDICRSCRYFDKCHSGCRAISEILYGDFSHLDPLANPEKYL